MCEFYQYCIHSTRNNFGLGHIKIVVMDFHGSG